MPPRSQSGAPGRPSARREEESPLVRHRSIEFGIWLFILFAVGRVGELIPGLATLPLVKIIIGGTLIALISNWKSLPRFSKSTLPIVRSASLLVALTVITLPISIWPGKSLIFLYQQLPVLVAAVVIVYKLSYSWRAIRETFMALVIAGTVLMAPALLGYAGGRASVASMYDTNDLAYVLVTVFPIAVAFVITSKSAGRRFIWISIVIGFVVTILLTSSRGGFLGLLAATSVIVLMPASPRTSVSGSSRGVKSRAVVSILACLSLSALIWPFLPSDTRQRLVTVFSIGGDYNLDTTNKTGRLEIWSRGMTALAQRPIGYGVDTFTMVDLRFGGKMMAPHNSFVQTSVELGVLGLFCFLRIYYLALKGLTEGRRCLLKNATRNRQQNEQVVFHRMLQASIFGNILAGFFLSMAYVTLFWIIIALAMACIATAQSSVQTTR